MAGGPLRTQGTSNSEWRVVPSFLQDKRISFPLTEEVRGIYKLKYIISHKLIFFMYERHSLFGSISRKQPTNQPTKKCFIFGGQRTHTGRGVTSRHSHCTHSRCDPWWLSGQTHTTRDRKTELSRTNTDVQLWDQTVTKWTWV